MRQTRTNRRGLVLAALVLGALLLGGAALLARNRMAECKYIPLAAAELLPNADLAPTGQARMPQGWARGANGVELRGKTIDPANTQTQGFDIDGNGLALQLIGIANYAETPHIAVQPGTSYCFVARALTDSDKRSATRLQVVFRWLDAQGRQVSEELTDWQPVVLWQLNAPAADWSTIRAAFAAPPGASALAVRLRAASDDRVYLDAMHVRRTTNDQRPTTTAELAPSGDGGLAAVVIEPWPNGAQGAAAFTFDWETAMGGLVHSRSLKDDPNAYRTYLDRGLAMRQGVTTTLDLFRPHAIRATYYATGYNFLAGNTEQRAFMDNPTFAWATISNGWQLDWSKKLWFGDDPHGTVQTQPAWYFGDLIPLLQREQQDIQSHTFSHFYAAYATPEQWRADFAAWRSVAAQRSVAPARSLAFPWSSSGGMSDDNWRALEQAGITSVTRTSWSQDQYDLFGRDKAGVPSALHCRPVPGHEAILACPDFYLHSQATAAQAQKLIDAVIAQGGVIDLWAHTEEVVDPQAQVPAWKHVVDYAAQRRDAGDLWLAPLTEIADWQQALQNVRLELEATQTGQDDSALTFTIRNTSPRVLNGVTLALPFTPKKLMINGHTQQLARTDNRILVNMQIGQAVEVRAWRA